MTYIPKTAQSETPIAQAIELLEAEMERYGVHTIYEGRNLVGGEDRGAAVVCVVEEKGPRVQARQIPSEILTPSGNRIPTDVVASPKPRDLRLRLPDFSAEAKMIQNDHQRCHDAPIPGGVQIAPSGARWVGTLGCAIKLPGGYGFLTNEHVSGLGNVGGKCCQPHGRADWIGEFTAVGGVRFNGENYIDAAVGISYRTDGPFAPGTHLVIPQQFGLGKLNPDPVTSPAVGMRVKKTGRTTRLTTGKIVGVNATSRVGYDEGTALFRRQLVIEAASGSFSAGGDSGSLIIDDQMRPVGLLFAGGGGQTIANLIGFVLDAFDAEFFV